MTQTFETGFKTVIAAPLSDTANTIVLKVAPSITAGRMCLKNGNLEEWIEFTGVTGTTLTGVVRGLSQTADPATAGTGLSWVAGTQIMNVAMHDQLVDKQQGDPILISATVYATTAARDTALGGDGVATLPYTNIYVTATGLFYNYNLSSGQWESIDTGTTTPNASATVAGKVEIATTAQSKAGTDTGETGALMSVLPSDIAKNTQSGTFVYGTDVGGDDTYVVALTPVLAAYTDGGRYTFTPTTTNTGACSVDFGPGVLNIKTKDGNDPQSGVIRALTPITGTRYGSLFILDNEDFATATNKGTSEMSTDAEAILGTDTTRYINPSQLSDGIQYLTGVGQATKVKSYWNFSLPWLVSTDIPSGNYATVVNSSVVSIFGGSYVYFVANSDATSSFLMTKGIFFEFGSTGSMTFATTKKVIVEFMCRLRAVGSEQFGFGLTVSNAPFIDYDDASVDAACFTISTAGALYGHTSNGAGTTNHTENLISGITLTNENTFRIEFDPGVDVKFYVNGVLGATNTTHLPNSDTILFGGGMQGNTSNNDVILMSQPYFSIEK